MRSSDARLIAEQRRHFREVIRTWDVLDLRGQIFAYALRIADEPRNARFYTVRARAIGHELRVRKETMMYRVIYSDGSHADVTAENRQNALREANRQIGIIHASQVSLISIALIR